LSSHSIRRRLSLPLRLDFIGVTHVFPPIIVKPPHKAITRELFAKILRVMQGLLQLAEKHPAAELEKAASVATHHGTWRLRDLKRLLALPGNVVQMDFLQTHPLIRSLEAYRIEPSANPTQNL
jgi:hypothetical protein